MGPSTSPTSGDSSRDLARIYGLGDFASVGFDAIPEVGGLAVLVAIKEERGGPFFSSRPC